MADVAFAPDPTKQPPKNPAAAKAAPKTPSIGGLETDLVKQTDQAEKDITSYQDSVGKLTNDFHDQLKALKDQAPKPPEDKPFKAPEDVNPLKAFGSSVGLLAGIASLFTRAPLTTSLNALGAGMKAINDGNATAYSHAYDEWKSNTEYAFKAFDAQNKAYDQMIDLAGKDYEAAINGIKTLATMTDDKPAQTALLMKGLEGVEELNIERSRLNMEIQDNYAKMIPAQIFKQSLDEYKVKNGKSPDAATMGQLWMDAQYGFGSGGTGAGGGDENLIDAIGHYSAPPLNIGTRNPQNKVLMDQVYAKYPKYKVEMYQGMQKAWNDFTSGKDASLIASGNKAIQHLNLLKQAFDAMNNGNLTALNAVKLRWEQETGSNLPTDYNAIADVAAGEIANFAVSGGGGGRGSTLADREKTQETISRNMAKGQGESVFSDYIGLMAGQMDSKRHQYDTIGLNQMKPFDDWLLPETREALSHHGGGSDTKKDFKHLWEQ